MTDPALQPAFHAWADRNWTNLSNRFRDALAKPLDLIDRFVERYR